MRTLYLKLAAGGMKRGARTFVPYIITCSCMIMVFYIIGFLTDNPFLDGVLGGDTMKVILRFGLVVMAVFSAIFLFYTNSFLIKSRKKEFGLYNVLGMGKLGIARIMIWETLIVYAVSHLLGLGTGILFSKLAELMALKIIIAQAGYEFYVDKNTIAASLICFAVIFAVILINSLRQVGLSKPIELLHSEAEGEKPPKVNHLTAILGVLILAGAYYLAVTTTDPLAALFIFLLAVIMVIVATYLLFISGSVALCGLLKKNKRYYYKTNHFVSVSQMSYRMRKNGAGLASICILSTMVLVTLSATICLYSGQESALRKDCPRDITLMPKDLSSEMERDFIEDVNAILAERGIAPENEFMCRYMGLSGVMNGDEVVLDPSLYEELGGITADIRNLYVIPAEDSPAFMGKSIELESGEAAVAMSDGIYDFDELRVDGYGTYRVAERIDLTDGEVLDLVPAYESIWIFVKDMDEVRSICEYQDKKYDNSSQLTVYYSFDMPCSDEEQIDAYHALVDHILGDYSFASSRCRAELRREGNGIYGGLLFLGILLGAVFLLSAVLIMYYKQVSEGFEDCRRFSILRKVGMTSSEISGAINSQVLTVFFLPLLAAGMHTAFAFPIISRMLALFSLTDTRLFLLVTVISYAAFAAVYIAVYKITSHSYMSIVSGKKER